MSLHHLPQYECYNQDARRFPCRHSSSPRFRHLEDAAAPQVAGSAEVASVESGFKIRIAQIVHGHQVVTQAHRWSWGCSSKTATLLVSDWRSSHNEAVHVFSSA